MNKVYVCFLIAFLVCFFGFLKYGSHAAISFFIEHALWPIAAIMSVFALLTKRQK